MASAFKQTDILLVDADTETLHRTATNLHAIEPNYEIEMATGREEAIQKLQGAGGQLPNIVIIDTKDPEILGFKILEEIRANHELKKVKALLVTEGYSEALVAKCSELDTDIMRKSTAEGEYLEQLRARISHLRRPV